ncbi:hypothetical protein NHX12_021392, partial [Muraenolepis orangiensis]
WWVRVEEGLRVEEVGFRVEEGLRVEALRVEEEGLSVDEVGLRVEEVGLSAEVLGLSAEVLGLSAEVLGLSAGMVWKEKLASLGTDTSSDATNTYQALCGQRRPTGPGPPGPGPPGPGPPGSVRASRLSSVSSQLSDGPGAPSPSARSSTSSWCEEPVPSHMDISTGHMILAYMEDHLRNKNRLEGEWEALCGYQAEPNTTYDHSRITLKPDNNHGNTDYINASPIMDHDPRNPTYISSQGPLPSTVQDFWQVNLVSEHIWCEDFLVRSFYLKNLQTNETRTVTQFHFLSWMDRGIPDSARTLLDFRRKVNKCYRGRACPIIVHCR